MQNLLKKLLFSLLIATTFLFSLAPFFQAKAQALWYNQSPFEWYSKVYDDTNSNEIFGERYTAAQVQWITYGLFFLPINVIFSVLGIPPTPVVCISNMIAGTTDIDTCSKALIDFLEGALDKTKLTGFLPNNNTNVVVEKTNKSVWKSIFSGNRSMSGIGYINKLTYKIKPVASAKAADSGFGYSKLGAIMGIWQISRDVAYFFLVLIIIVSSFMILFKVKISPQAVVTLQQSIPKVVVSVILVTFSYAIAGFCVDLIYVFMGLFSQFFGPFVGSNVADTYNFLNGINPDGSTTILLYSITYWVFSIVVSLAITLTAMIQGSGILIPLLLVLFFFINIIILIVYIAIGLFNMFKALANFYLEVFLGPIKLAIGALPTSKGAFASWLKKIIANLAVFPVTGILWYFGFFFMMGALNSILYCFQFNLPAGFAQKILDLMSSMFGNGGFSTWWSNHIVGGQCWGPPLLGNAGIATGVAFLLLSASFILLIAKAPKMIKSAIEGQPFDMEGAISEPVNKAWGYTGGPLVEGVTKKVGENIGNKIKIRFTKDTIPTTPTNTTSTPTV